jgi:hypothetical protein
MRSNKAMELSGARMVSDEARASSGPREKEMMICERQGVRSQLIAGPFR